jgi:lipopolysaccharide/colanic/teichoic acid biosynthesis glycosyltransferase
MISSRNDSKHPVLARTPLSKRVFDVLLSGVGLVLAIPVGAAAALAIKLGDGGPVFFSQERVGRGGVPFRSYKFRSMAPDADRKFGTVQAVEHDPRVTAAGRILRKTAMDELPQLWNIFKGDMSFVGPRALAVQEVELKGDGRSIRLEEIPGFTERHRVIPGLTGVAQIFAPRDIPRRQKFRYDRLYVLRQSFALDIKLILVSFWITFRGKWEVRGEKF